VTFKVTCRGITFLNSFNSNHNVVSLYVKMLYVYIMNHKCMKNPPILLLTEKLESKGKGEQRERVREKELELGNFNCTQSMPAHFPCVLFLNLARKTYIGPNMCAETKSHPNFLISVTVSQLFGVTSKAICRENQILNSGI